MERVPVLKLGNRVFDRINRELVWLKGTDSPALGKKVKGRLFWKFLLHRFTFCRLEASSKQQQKLTEVRTKTTVFIY